MEDNTKPNANNTESEVSKEGKKEKKFEGSGIFTVDGKELPKIPGGYDLVEPDSGLGGNDFVDR